MPLKDRARQNEYQRRYYERNKRGFLDRNNAKRTKMREWLRAQKDGKPCADCDIPYPWYVLDFDHSDWREKTEIVSRLINHLSWRRLKDEIAKCQLLCANCHRIRTHRRLSIEPSNIAKGEERSAKSVQSVPPTIH